MSIGQEYISKCDVLNAAQAIAYQSGFAVTTRSSSLYYLYIQYKYAVFEVSKWNIVNITDEYNHLMAKSVQIYPEYHQLKQEVRRMAVKMLEAGAKSSIIYEAIRNKDGEPTATRKDIDNLRAQIHPSEENASIEALVIGMEKRVYTVRHEDFEGKHLFFCHIESIKNAKRFFKVILIDATYKTNIYKLLFVNIIGISNLGINELRTFSIAGTWISDESKKSYMWIAEQLLSLIFFDIISSVFVTDNNSALIGALKKKFPESSHLLCTWHVLNNFKKNLKKYFKDDSFDEIIKIVDCVIHSKDYEILNTAIVGAYTSRIMHFGATTTQYVEGTHSAMKHVIETSGSLIRSFNICIDPLLAQDDKKRLVLLLRKISQFALNKIKKELLKATKYEACIYELHVNYNLPCRYILSEKAQYMSFSDEQQKTSLLNKLDMIFAVSETKLSEIKLLDKIKTKDDKLKILLSSLIPAKDIDQIYNPKSDSNCGFRAFAVAIIVNEEKWALVKLAISNQLKKRIEIYQDWLAADTFTLPIAIFNETNRQSMLFFLLEVPPIHRKTPIILHFINSNHIIYVSLKTYEKVNWPMINI
ncbi:6761_t:CDS:2 [Scutellospora calospora]|uniref:6761_t:CDS:1 n=1 Tax=Scutellospora calospora TaxID=85575 RepID=A0ACA9LQI4_9GLOM|nr:6761_t:CDS:2 [Scutellospora calospora]